MAKKETVLQFTLQDGVTKTLRAIGSGVGKLGEQFENLNASVELFGKIGNGIKSGFGLGTAVAEVAELDDVLARVFERMGAGAEEQQQLRAAVDAAVATTRASGQEAATVLEQLSREGLTAAESIGALNQVLGFAQANGAGAAQSVGTLLDVLGGFNEPANQVGILADKLTALSRATGAPVEVLQEGLSRVAVVAEQTGESLDSTLQTIGALATRSIEGGRAGAQLATILQQLADPASKAGRALEAAGLQGKSFTDILSALSKDTATAEQVLASLGARPRAALQALLDVGAPALAGLRTALDDSAGASQRAAEALNQTLAGALERVVNAFDQTKAKFLEPLLPELAAEFNDLAADLAAFSETAQFDKLRQDFKDFVLEGVASLREFAEGFDFEGAAARLSSFVSTASSLLGTLAKGVGVVTDVVEVFGAGVAAPFNLLDAAWEGSKSIAASAGKIIVDTTQAVIGETVNLSNASDQLGTIAEESYNKAGQAAQNFGGNVKTFVVGPTDEATEATRKLKEQQGELQTVLEGIAKAGQGYLDGLKSAGLQLADSVGLSGERIKQVGTALQGISEEAKLAALNARAEFLTIANAADSTGEQISEAFRNAIQSANNKAELDALQVEFNKLGLAGKLSWEQLAAGSEALAFKLKDLAQAAIPELEKQFKALGITSQVELDKAAAAARVAFDAIEEGARNGSAATEDVGRAFEAFARKQLAAADGADEFKRRQVEAMLTSKAEALGLVDTLQELGIAGEEATGKLATGADRATEALSGTRDVAEETTTAARDLGTASSSAAGSITQVQQSATAATGSVSGLSRAYQDASAQAVGFGLSQDGLREQFNSQLQDLQRLADGYRQTIRELDPFEKTVADLEERFDGVDRSILENIARLKQRAEGLREEVRKTNEVVQASSSFGGGSANGPQAGRSPNGPGSSFGPNGPGAGGNGQPVVNLNIVNNVPPGAQMTPAAQDALARQLIPAIRRILAAGATGIRF